MFGTRPRPSPRSALAPPAHRHVRHAPPAQRQPVARGSRPPARHAAVRRWVNCPPTRAGHALGRRSPALPAARSPPRAQ
eukprot:7079475-Prymnesium_polylepis.1